MSFGLALGGGGVRAAAHVGVLLALKDHGLKPATIAGTSAGAIAAGLYVAGVTPEQMRDWVNKLSFTGKQMLDIDYKAISGTFSQLLTLSGIKIEGLIKGKRLEEDFYKMTGGKNIMRADRRIVIPAIDLISGEVIAFVDSLQGVNPMENVKWATNVMLSQAIRASISLPAVFKPKRIGGMCLVDGGITENLPVDLLMAAGGENVIAVDVSQGYQAPKEINMIEVISHSFSIMRGRLTECSAQHEKLTIRPKLPKEAGILSFDRLGECMDAGYEAVENAIEEIKSIAK